MPTHEKWTSVQHQSPAGSSRFDSELVHLFILISTLFRLCHKKRTCSQTQEVSVSLLHTRARKDTDMSQLPKYTVSSQLFNKMVFMPSSSVWTSACFPKPSSRSIFITPLVTAKGGWTRCQRLWHDLNYLTFSLFYFFQGNIQTLGSDTLAASYIFLNKGNFVLTVVREPSCVSSSSSSS